MIHFLYFIFISVFVSIIRYFGVTWDPSLQRITIFCYQSLPSQADQLLIYKVIQQFSMDFIDYFRYIHINKVGYSILVIKGDNLRSNGSIISFYIYTFISRWAEGIPHSMIFDLPFQALMIHILLSVSTHGSLINTQNKWFFLSVFYAKRLPHDTRLDFMYRPISIQE